MFQFTVIQSLTLQFLVYTFGFVYSLILYFKYNKKYADIEFISLFFILNAIGMLLILFREDLTLFISVIIANSLLVIGHMSLLYGIYSLKGKKYPLILSLIVTILFVLAFIVFTYITPNVIVRIIVIELVFIYFLGSLIFGLKENNKKFYVISDVMDITVLLLIVVHFFRIFRVLLMNENSTTFFNLNSDALSIVFLAIATVFLLAGILSLITNLIYDELENTGRIFENGIRNAPTPIMVHAEDGEVLNISMNWEKLTKYTLEDIPTIYEWTEKAYGKKKLEVQDFIKKLHTDVEQQHDQVFVVTTKDNRKISWDFHSGNIGVLSDGRRVAMSVAIDVTERLAKEKEIEYLSYHDALTGVYNRRYYEQEILKYEDDKYYPISIIVADINGLKLVNDAFGHLTGDVLLREAVEVFKSIINESDFISRIGGDEFIICLLNTDRKLAEEKINSMKKKCKDAFIHSIELSISFGTETKENQLLSFIDLFKSAEDSMYRMKLLEVPSMRSSAIETILSTLFEKDGYTEKHSRNVSDYAAQLATFCNQSTGFINEVKTVGLLHDIGKIIVSKNILTKEGKLSEEEFREIKQHPEIGFRILNSTSDMRKISGFVLAHHERWDGTGYPRGLKGENIPLQSRIIAITDAFDAMISERLYKDKRTVEDALLELKRCSGTQFDPNLVKVFIKHFDEFIVNQ